MRNLPVKLGLSLPNRGVLFGLSTVDALIQAAELADQSDVFESVWFGDSLIHKPRLEAIVMLAAVSTRTRRVRLGTICMASFPVRDPVLLAIQWASLDQVSNGRTILGICIGGGYEPELRAFRVKKEERVGRLKEGMLLLRQLWKEGEVNHQGRFYSLTGCEIIPKPKQKLPPIWIAVSPDRSKVGDKVVDQAMRRVGELADGYITMGVTREEFQRRWDVIQAAAEENGRDLSTFETSIHGMVNINESKRNAYEESRFYFDHYYGPGYPTKEMIKVWLAHGPPEECATLIQSWIDMGITTPVLRFTSYDQLKQLQLFIEQVLPHLRVK
jgi:alkanesulfonate monooxygenase SsuD/methylene tetrahydromethanopterin reductase-like flavin-dependent oxidoreductase (luciferase family)